MATYPKILTKGVQSALLSVPVESGKVRFTTDTGQLFLDEGDERIEITDFVKGYTEAELETILAPLPKIYLTSDTHKLYVYDGENWLIAGEQSHENVAHASKADHATKATQDNSGQNIASTYIKAVSVSGKTVTFTRGDNTTFTIQTKDTTYSDMKGATASANGTHGLVPAPASGNQDKFLRGDGTWTNPHYAAEADHATEADHAGEADHATTADSAAEATHATEADKASHATSADNATKATSATKATGDANGKQINTTYAPLASPVLTGSPTTPTPAAGDNSKKIANTAFVTAAIAAAVGKITSFETQVLESIDDLPETGVAGTIYFVAAGYTETTNIYDEYIWTGTKYEKIGTSAIDLSEYLNNVVVSGTGNAVTGITKSGNKLTLKKDSTFLTAHPSVSLTSTTGTESPAANATFEVIDSIVLDAYGHLSSYRKKTVKMPNSVATATTATKDASGNTISGYIKALSVSGKTITYTKGDGTTGTITTQDTTYNTGTTSTAGLTKLYTATGSATDGTMTQKAITDALAGKSGTGHTHNYAGSNSAGGAATKAVGDEDGQNIASTYIKALSVSGKVITYTKGDGTTGTISTQDTNTTYTTGTTSTAGLTKLYTSTGTSTDGTMTRKAITDALATKSASGHTHNYAGSDSAGGAATKAVGDSNGNSIIATYIKSLSVSGKTITWTKGDGTTGTLTTQDTNTTYNTGTTSTAGLTKLYTATGSGTDGTMTQKAITDALAGKAASSHGNHVPATQTANNAIFLRNDNTWQTVTPANIGAAAASHTHNYAASSHSHAYISALSVSGKVITYTKGDGTTGTLTTQDTNTTYNTGTTSTAGLTKLYTSTGTSTDGTMTRAAITTALAGKAKGASISAATAATTGWYRIAASAASISRCAGIFEIEASVSGKHTVATIGATTTYGVTASSNIIVLQCGQYSGSAITKARIVYHTTYSSNYAYLEVYVPDATARTIYVNLVGGNGWTLVNPSTAGSVPSGYTSKEVTLSNGTMYSPYFSGNGASLTGLNAGNISAGTLPIARGGTGATDAAGARSNLGLGSAATYSATSSVTSGSGALVTSGAVYTGLAGKANSSHSHAYISALSVSGRTITWTKGDGTTGTITTQDNNTTYSTGTTSTAGLTKLYTSTGTSTDGTMTQKAITDALAGKAASSHTHSYAATSHTHAYISALSVSGKTITWTKGDGSTGTITTQDTNTTYSTGTTSTAGLTKLYTSTGTSTDGTMTRKAITDAVGACIKSLSVSGKVITYTKSDGTTGTITTQDTNTTYSLSSFGITATATELNYLDGVTGVKNGTAAISTTYGTGDKHLINSAFLSYWNGAYSTGGASNLAYCNKGAFGSIVTKNAGDYAAASHSHTFGSLEFTPGTSAGHGGFIDFHYNGSTADYTSRIIESSSGVLSVTGKMVGQADTAYTTNQFRNIVFTTTDPGAGVSTSYSNGSLICVYE